MEDDQVRAAIEAQLYREHQVMLRWDGDTGEMDAIYKESTGPAAEMRVRLTDGDVLVRYDPQTLEVLSVITPRPEDDEDDEDDEDV